MEAQGGEECAREEAVAEPPVLPYGRGDKRARRKIGLPAADGKVVVAAGLDSTGSSEPPRRSPGEAAELVLAGRCRPSA